MFGLSGVELDLDVEDKTACPDVLSVCCTDVDEQKICF